MNYSFAPYCKLSLKKTKNEAPNKQLRLRPVLSKTVANSSFERPLKQYPFLKAN